MIGAGNVGATLTRRLTALGHQVAVANSRGPETLSELADETGATAVSVDEVAKGADIVIVTIPQKIVDTGNYYRRVTAVSTRSRAAWLRVAG